MSARRVLLSLPESLPNSLADKRTCPVFSPNNDSTYKGGVLTYNPNKTVGVALHELLHAAVDKNDIPGKINGRGQMSARDDEGAAYAFQYLIDPAVVWRQLEDEFKHVEGGSLPPDQAVYKIAFM